MGITYRRSNLKLLFHKHELFKKVANDLSKAVFSHVDVLVSFIINYQLFTILFCLIMAEKVAIKTIEIDGMPYCSLVGAKLSYQWCYTGHWKEPS